LQAWNLVTCYTIVALSTARGPSAIAVIRVSGPGAGRLLLSFAPGLQGKLPPARHATLTTVVDPTSGDVVDRALVTWFPNPNSYTGEDSFEVATHGGQLVPRLTLDSLIAAGARAALPGEFTRRAFVNGKLDLLEAEAVVDLIEANSPALHRAALHQVEGGLSRRIGAIRSKLVALAAATAYGIDFPDEDEPPVPYETIVASAHEVSGLLVRLLDTVPHGELIREGALVVLAGKPNSGKSSLLNALCGKERALVTPVPGTTRDAVEVLLPIDGYPVRLVDTAGIRDTDDPVESLGIEVARRYVAGADLVLMCAEAGSEFGAEEEAFISGVQGDVLVLRTKSDLAAPVGQSRHNELRVSAHTGAGLASLRQELATRLFGGLTISADAPVVTRERHARALRAALEEVELFAALLSAGGAPEVASVHLSSAMDALDELIGRVDHEEVLDAVFSSFCVGK
jgi:tRNA modification GTPase